MHRTPRTRHRWLGALAAIGLLAGACSGDDDTSVFDGPDVDAGDVDTGDCIRVDASVSSEKIELLTELANDFNRSDEADVDGACVSVVVQKKASGGSAQLLADGWDETIEGPRPVIWSPASSAWRSVLDQRLRDKGDPTITTPPVPFMLTPLVIAMPEPMARALGWPDEPLGWNDILELTRSGQGWAEFGHPEWGTFKLGKTNPNFSTSGLSALIAQTYAATGKTSGLSAEDLSRPEVIRYGTEIESAVVHYGDTTLTFLNNWYRADQRGNPFAYTSAAAVEEKSIIDYNRGNPDGILAQGEQPRPPRVPLVAIYPEEGTLYSDNPLIVLDADWVDDDQAAGARRFIDFVQRDDNQRKVLEFGFRPGNPDVTITDPISADFGLDPSQPRTLLEVPEPSVLVQVLDAWATQRKGARVTLVIDVSGSMGEAAVPGSLDTKLDLAKQAAIAALDEFKDDDQVGLVTFTTNDTGSETIVQELLAPSRVGDVRERLASELRGLFPQWGTPLYEVARTTYAGLADTYDPARINAMVLLTDGRNDDGDSGDDGEQLRALLDTLEAGSEGAVSKPVRVFPIAYGSDADLGILEQIASASNAAVYDASDPATISKVFTAVVSNF